MALERFGFWFILATGQVFAGGRPALRSAPAPQWPPGTALVCVRRARAFGVTPPPRLVRWADRSASQFDQQRQLLLSPLEGLRIRRDGSGRLVERQAGGGSGGAGHKRGLAGEDKNSNRSAAGEFT